MCTTDVIYTGFKYLRPEVIGRLVPQFILHPDSLLTQLRTDSISTLDRLSMYLCISPHRLRLDFPSTQTRLPIDSDSTPIDSELTAPSTQTGLPHRLSDSTLIESESTPIQCKNQIPRRIFLWV